MKNFLQFVFCFCTILVHAQYSRINQTLNPGVGVGVSGQSPSHAALSIRVNDNPNYSGKGGQQILFAETTSDIGDNFRLMNYSGYRSKFVPVLLGSAGNHNSSTMVLMSNTTSSNDNGVKPMMLFNARVDYNSRPQFSGYTGKTVSNRPLFAWQNYSSTKMLMKANGYLGLGTTNPTAQLNTTGTLRFQNLPNGTTPTYLLGTDSSGNVKEYPASVSGGGSDKDWAKTGGGTPTSIYNNIYTYGNVGVNTPYPSAKLHTNGTVRLQNLPSGRGNPSYLLGVDYNGNVKKYRQITIFLKEMKETIQKQENQITLLQNQISSIRKDSSLDLLENNKSTSFSTNFPNPFSSTTNIDYTILKNVGDAKIIIYNSNGSTIKTYELKERENKGKLIISKEGMKPGVYFYTMITDGIVVGTKKMIVK